MTKEIPDMLMSAYDHYTVGKKACSLRYKQISYMADYIQLTSLINQLNISLKSISREAPQITAIDSAATNVSFSKFMGDTLFDLERNVVGLFNPTGEKTYCPSLAPIDYDIVFRLLGKNKYEPFVQKRDEMLAAM